MLRPRSHTANQEDEYLVVRGLVRTSPLSEPVPMLCLEPIGSSPNPHIAGRPPVADTAPGR
jgi:hypothetical protein